MDKHEKFMQMALELACSAKDNGDEPFGALLVKNNEVVMTSENRIFSNSDPTMHAELALISEFCRKNKTRDLSEYTLYTSCEPCFMCSGATVWSNLKTLVYSASSSDLNKILGEKEFSSSDIVYSNSHYQPEVIKNILHEEGVKVLKSYFSR